MFPCEFCKISKNTFLTEHLWTAASIIVLISGKLPSRKLPPMKIPLYGYSPLWKLPPRIIPPRKFPMGKYPQWNPLLTYKSYKWKKQQNYKIFSLEESCVIQHPYQNNQGPLWYTDGLTENAGLRYFLYRMKKNPKIGWKRKSPSGIYLPVAQVKEN